MLFRYMGLVPDLTRTRDRAQPRDRQVIDGGMGAGLLVFTLKEVQTLLEKVFAIFLRVLNLCTAISYMPW